LSFDVDSLSYFAVTYDAVPEDNGGHSSMMLYVAIGAIAAIAAIGGVFLFLRKSKS
jgi:LPXTG-motif cell wall-anchored protein